MRKFQDKPFQSNCPLSRVCLTVCGKTVTIDDHLGLSCRFGYGRHSRDNQINHVLCSAFTTSGTLVTREPHSLCTGSGKRTDVVTHVPWSSGRYLAWDAPYPDTFAVSHVLPAVHVLVQRQQQQKRWNRKSTLTSQPASISSLFWGPGARRPFTWTWKSEADWQLWPTNHVQKHFFVGVFQWQFNAATPSRDGEFWRSDSAVTKIWTAAIITIIITC